MSDKRQNLDEYETVDFYKRHGETLENGFSSFEHNGKHYFCLYVDGDITLLSQAYSGKSGRDNGIKSVIKNSKIPERFRYGQRNDGKEGYSLIAGNRQEIAVSVPYGTEAKAKQVTGKIQSSNYSVSSKPSKTVSVSKSHKKPVPRKSSNNQKTSKNQKSRRGDYKPLAFYETYVSGEERGISTFKADNGLYYFTYSEGGKIRLISEGYPTTSARDKGAVSVRKNITERKRYRFRKLKNGKFDYTLKARNGQEIARSIWYGSSNAAVADVGYISGTRRRTTKFEKPQSGVAKSKPKSNVLRSKIKAGPPESAKLIDFEVKQSLPTAMSPAHLQLRRVERKKAAELKKAAKKKDAAAKKPAAKKPTPKKTAAEKPKAKPATPKKTTTTSKAASAPKKPAAKKAAPKKAAPKKTAPKKPTAKKAAVAAAATGAALAAAKTAKAAPKKPATKNAASKKAAPKKPVAKTAASSPSKPKVSNAKAAPKATAKPKAKAATQAKPAAKKKAAPKKPAAKTVTKIAGTSAAATAIAAGTAAAKAKAPSKPPVKKTRPPAKPTTTPSAAKVPPTVKETIVTPPAPQQPVAPVAPVTPAIVAPAPTASPKVVAGTAAAATAGATVVKSGVGAVSTGVGSAGAASAAAIGSTGTVAAGSGGWGWLKWLIPLLLLLLLSLFGLKTCQSDQAVLPPVETATTVDDVTTSIETPVADVPTSSVPEIVEPAPALETNPVETEAPVSEPIEPELIEPEPIEPDPIESAAVEVPEIAESTVSTASPEPVASSATPYCGPSDNVLFNVPLDKTPVNVLALGTFPEYGNSHGLTPAEFYNKLSRAYNSSAFERGYLNFVARSIGYNSFAEITASDFSETSLPYGSQGILGFAEYHGLQYAKLNVTDPKDLEAFKIRGANGQDVQYMKTCGNFMYVCQ